MVRRRTFVAALGAAPLCAEGEPLYEPQRPIAVAALDAVNALEIDRKLPAQLPRESIPLGSPPVFAETLVRV